ncbi:MAG: thioredoxin domain-containing protein [Planctomycetia bacterium]|nr:thioredoxin domain-containing protein [Planctomycetia bacterium]
MHSLFSKNIFILVGICSFIILSGKNSLVMGQEGSAAGDNHKIHASNRIISSFQKSQNGEEFYKYNNSQDDHKDDVPDSRVVLLDFYGDYCGPCRRMSPVIDRLCSRGFSIKKINTSEETSLAQKYGVSSIPCFVILADGKEYTRMVGMTSETKLAEVMRQAGRSLRPVPSVEFSVAQEQTPKQVSSEGITVNQRRNISENAKENRKTRARSAWRGLEVSFPVEEIAANRWNPPRQRQNGEKNGCIQPVSYSIPVSGGENAGTVTENSVAASENAEVQRAPEIQKNLGIQRAEEGGKQNFPAIKSSDEKHLLASTVRIRLNGGTGSGTIIDSREGRALILTCGHLFSDYRPGDKIEVDLFGENRFQNVEAVYLSHDYHRNDGRDLAVISIPVHESVNVSPVAAPNFHLRKGMPISTAGCSHGNIPTLQKGVITGVNRYLGCPNLVVSAQPVQGRSGGGMFSPEGELLGVCNSADPENNEGIYISLEAIHAYLNRIKLSKVIHNPRNESILLAEKKDIRSQMPLKMPESEPVRQLTDLPRVSMESKEASRKTHSVQEMPPVSPYLPENHVQDKNNFASADSFPEVQSAQHESHNFSAAENVSVQVKPRSLTGAPLPAWPPRW